MDSSHQKPKKKAKNTKVSHSKVPISCKTTESNSELNTKNEEEEIKRKAKQEILVSLFEKKAHYDGKELHAQVSQIDKQVLNTISEEDIQLFCQNSKQKKDDPESIMSRIFIPKEEKFNMVQVLLYNALYPWDVEKENESNCWSLSLPVLMNLAYATCYGHPKTADMLWVVCGGVMLHEYKKQIAEGFEALHAEFQTSCKEYIYYLPEPTCDRSEETYVEFLDMPYQEAAKHFQKLLWISKYGVSK